MKDVHLFRNTNWVAERLGISPATVRYWRHTGYGPVGVKFGRRVMYDEGRVEAWIAKIEKDQRGAV